MYGTIIIAILAFGLLIAFVIDTIPELYYKYKKESLTETEKTSMESIKLAQKVTEKEIEMERTKQLQIKSDYMKEYGKELE